MKKSLTIALLSSAAILCAAPVFKIEPEKDIPLYKCGEKAKFKLTATENGELSKSGKVRILIARDSTNDKDIVNVDLAKTNPFTVELASDRPGFVHFRLPGDKKDKRGKFPYYRAIGAGFDVDKIEMGYDLPADFMEFWQNGMKKVAANEVKMVKNPKNFDGKFSIYDISVKTLDNETIYGYLAIPSGKGPFPLLINIPGAGRGSIAPDIEMVNAGAMVLLMNVHKFNCEPKKSVRTKVYAEHIKKLGVNYWQYRMDDREKYYYYGTYVAINRAIDHVVSLPECDKTRVVVDGVSQGGGSALIIGALNKNITAVSSHVTALSDHGAFLKGRDCGWPHFKLRAEQQNVKLDAINKVAPYFDAANFARFVKVPTLVSVGFVDKICTPASVYAAYNQLKCEKEMMHMPTVGHAVPGKYNEYRKNWLLKKLGLDARQK